MRPHHYLAVLVRLFAILLFVYAMKQSGQLIDLAKYEGTIETAFPISSVIYMVVMPLVISLGLWLFPVIVAGLILKPEIDQEIDSIDSQGLFCVLISAIGLYVGINAFIDSVYFIFLWQISSSQETLNDLRHYFQPDTKANIIATAAQLVLGLVLIFKSKSIARKLGMFTS